MTLSTSDLIETNSFHLVVFEFIERIGRDVSVYEDYESKFSAKDFQHIELQIQAQRIEKILNLCIEKIPLAFHLFYLIEQQRDHLNLLFAKQDAQKIQKFIQKWSQSKDAISNSQLLSDLNVCLDIVKKRDAIKNWEKV